MMRRLRIAGLTAALFLGAASEATAQDAKELAALCIEAYGGEEAIAAANAFVQRGEIVTAGGTGEPGRIYRAFSRPDRLRVEIDRPDRDPEVRVLVGDEGWRGGRPVGGAMHLSMVLQAIRMDFAAFLLAAPEQIGEARPVVRDGTEYRVLVLEIGRGLTLTVEIHPETGQVRRSIARIPVEGMPRPFEFINIYSDYREVGGVMFAFREVTYAQGRHTSDITLTEVEIVESLPDVEFEDHAPRL